MLRELEDSNADLDRPFILHNKDCNYEMLLIHIACRNCSYEIVNYLLHRKGVVSSSLLKQTVKPTESTVMHMAAQGGKAEIIELLCGQGADSTAINIERDTPLHVAIRHGHIEFSIKLINYLILTKCGKNRVDIENVSEKMTPYFMAVLQGYKSIAKKLVQAGLCDPTRRNADGKTIENLAVELCSRKACDFLKIEEPEPDLVKRFSKAVLS